MELLNIYIHHNERWPRQDIMYIPTFLLHKGDKMEFRWDPKHEGTKLSVDIEQTDYKADYSRNAKKIAQLEIKDREEFQITEKGLYNFPIENPESYSDGDIGQLIFNLKSEDNLNPFPERFYDYSKLKMEKGLPLKNCKKWGYRTDIGANILKESDATQMKNMIFNSAEKGFHYTRLSKDRIKKVVFFEADKNEKITLQVTKRNIDGYNIHTSVDKHNTVGFRGKPEACHFFIANEAGIYKFESEIYEFGRASKGTIPQDFIELKIYSDQHNHELDFMDKYDLKEVYNTCESS
jgi:hypothetical protein